MGHNVLKKSVVVSGVQHDSGGNANSVGVCLVGVLGKAIKWCFWVKSGVMVVGRTDIVGGKSRNDARLWWLGRDLVAVGCAPASWSSSGCGWTWGGSRFDLPYFASSILSILLPPHDKQIKRKGKMKFLPT